MNPRDVHWRTSGPVTTYGSLSEFLTRTTTPAGNVEIRQNGHPLQMHWSAGSDDVTFVVFSAAVSPSVASVPAFSGMRTTEHLSANVLMISDPSLILDRELTLGWYAGNSRWPRLQDDLTQVITSFARDSRIVLFGASGGGYAALEQSTRMPGSVVLAVNPQTDTNRYLSWAIERYDRVAWQIEERRLQPYSSTVVPAFSQPVDANVIYVQNTGDVFHVRNHWQPFASELHEDNRVLLLSPDLGKGHVGPGSESYRALFSAVTMTSDWAQLHARCETLTLTSV